MLIDLILRELFMLKNLILSTWLEDEASRILANTFKEIRSIADTKKADRENIDKLLTVHFLDSLISSMVYKYLSEFEIERISDEEKYKKTSDNFIKVKLLISNAVSNGFENAVSQFSGQKMDYWCKIEPMPKAVNKRPI